MWEFEKGLLPASFNDNFKYTQLVHTVNTRQARKNNFKPARINTEFFGRASIHYQGPLIGNEIKKLPFYMTSEDKTNF